MSKFDHFETTFWTIFGVKKVLFPVFSKVFWSCSGSAWALFLIEMSSFGFTFSYKVCFPYFPITKFLLWGPAKPYKTSTRLSSATSCFKIFLPLRHSHLFPKGEFLKELSEGSHWFEWLSSPCLIV